MPRATKQIGNYTPKEIAGYKFKDAEQQETYDLFLEGNEYKPLAHSLALIQTLIQTAVSRGEVLTLSKLQAQETALLKAQQRMLIEQNLVIPIDCIDDLIAKWSDVISRHMVGFMAGGPLKVQGLDDDYVPTPDGFYKAFDEMAADVADATTEIIQAYVNEAKRTGPRERGRKVGE